MIVVGLTGGIGSGKTTVAREFERLGVPVFIADDAGKIVMQQSETIQLIRQKFGEEVILDNAVNSKVLAGIVFQDPIRLRALNEIVHPRVAMLFSEWLQQHQDKHYVIKEAAILFESGAYKSCDKIITVTAEIETRIQRVMKRDHADRIDVTRRIRNQWSEDQRIQLSDYIIENNNTSQTAHQILKIHEQLMNIQ